MKHELMKISNLGIYNFKLFKLKMAKVYQKEL